MVANLLLGIGREALEDLSSLLPPTSRGVVLGENRLLLLMVYSRAAETLPARISCLEKELCLGLSRASVGPASSRVQAKRY
jgi:hypothetical protein